MAFGSGQVSTEGGSIKRYIGVASVFVLAVNPSKEELEKLYGRSLDNAPEYISETEVGPEGNKTKVPQVRIDFIVKADPEKYLDSQNQPLDFISKVSLYLAKSYRIGANSGKYQVIDKYGRTAWATKEDIQAKRIPQYANGPANIDADYRPAYIGEEELIGFLKAYLNIPSVEKWENKKVVGLIDHPEDAEAMLEHLDDYFKGDFKELREIIGFQPNNKLKVLFGVKNTDDNKQYQTVYSKMFMKNNVTDYSRLDKSVKETQEAGAMQNVEFDCTELHEYVVESSNFPQQGGGDMPFPPAQGATPWGGGSN